ncbi:MAG: hypothetical protein Q9178_001237 [Gyalolechia marmorata]
MKKIKNINVFHTGQVEQLVQAEQVRKVEQLRQDLDNYICEKSLDDVLHILSRKQELEAQEEEARYQASWKKPNPESQDPMERLAAHWRDPEKKRP